MEEKEVVASDISVCLAILFFSLQCKNELCAINSSWQAGKCVYVCVCLASQPVVLFIFVLFTLPLKDVVRT